MPYIEKDKREDADKYVDAMLEYLKSLPENEQDGTLNYSITRLLKGLYPKKYFHLNRAMGVLESIKSEFYRRDVAPYEDEKIEENGDVS